MRILAAALLLAAAPMMVHGATIYRCETSSGKVEYRDTPCPGGGGTAAEFKDETPQQRAAARESLANTREQAAALTERLEARERARIAADERAARYAPAPIIVEPAPAPAPVVDVVSYPFGYPCVWAGCWPGYNHPPKPLPARVVPPPAPPPSVTMPPPIPPNMRKREQ